MKNYISRPLFYLLCLFLTLGLATSACNTEDSVHLSNTENQDDPDNQNQDDPENQNQDDPENQNQDDPENQNQDDPENQNQDDPPTDVNHGPGIGLQGAAGQTSSANYKLQVQVGSKAAGPAESDSYQLNPTAQ